MEFLKRMKKREYIEMGLKTAIGVLLGIIVIFLMEAMICGIYMDAINSVKTWPSTASESVYYIVDNKDASYDIYINYEPGGADVWARAHDNLSADDYHEKMIKATGALYNTNRELFYIVDSEDNTYDSSTHAEKDAFQQVKYIYKNKHKGETFTVYTRETTSDSFTVHSEDLSYSKLVELFSAKGELQNAKKLIFRAPNCFEIYIDGVHYTVMVLFILAIGGVFVWRFTLITKEYKKLEKRLNKTGKIF